MVIIEQEETRDEALVSLIKNAISNYIPINNTIPIEDLLNVHNNITDAILSEDLSTDQYNFYNIYFNDEKGLKYTYSLGISINEPNLIRLLKVIAIYTADDL